MPTPGDAQRPLATPSDQLGDAEQPRGDAEGLLGDDERRPGDPERPLATLAYGAGRPLASPDDIWVDVN